MSEALERIPDPILDRSVSGFNLMPGSLRDQLGETPTLLVFLRHFGCIFCRETVADLRVLSESDPSFPPVLFFFHGSATEGRAFLRRYWPTARAVADPNLEAYDAFGIGQARVMQALGPQVWMAQRRARAKGHRNGERSGDIWRMPGVFYVEGPKILWRYEPRHAGDHPEFAEVAAIARL